MPRKAGEKYTLRKEGKEGEEDCTKVVGRRGTRHKEMN